MSFSEEGQRLWEVEEQVKLFVLLRRMEAPQAMG